MPLTDQSVVEWNQLSWRPIPYLKASTPDMFAYDLQAQDWTTQGLCRISVLVFLKKTRHSVDFLCSRRFAS